MLQLGAPSASGLDDVVVARTALSDVDGERGRLTVSGYDIEDLAGRIGFEDVCGLLWDGALPDDARRAELRAAIAAGRVEAFARLPELGTALERADGMDALRAACGHLGSRGTEVADAATLTGAIAVYAAAWSRTWKRRPLVAPDPTLSHAADYLWMRSGQAPGPSLVTALDAYLVTVAEHGMNASTFTARMVASTESDLASAVVAALCALKGRLHGGAPGPVLEMLDAIAVPERATEWLEAEQDAGRRIMGMGHRVYRVRDPRAAVLERASRALEGAGLHTERLALARAVEAAARGVLRARHPSRRLDVNVEFYTAVLLDALGLEPEAFTPTFAVARVAGWCAHVREQRRVGRLVRPASEYVGPEPRYGDPQT